MDLRVIFCILTTFAATTVSTEEGPIIKTALGNVMGRYAKSYEGRTYTAFEGIPYAKPPIGKLRFQEPQPAEPWTDTLIANKTYACMQYTWILPMRSAVGNEDCLYLYVHIPKENITGNENLDVIVHIHGGAFLIGDPRSLAGPEYIMDRDVVYVSMNYRLGLLGFLSTEDEVVPGNNGLKDQTLALKWIKENIKLFGGNPDSVTLTGSSAGAAAVHHHYFSPLSKGLFHRGLSQSGTSLNVWTITKNPLQNAKKLGQLFNCSTESTTILVDCLRDVPIKELVPATGDFFVFVNGLPFNPFAPVIEHRPGAFLPDHPFKLLTEGKFNDYPWITANTVGEGAVPVGCRSLLFILFKKLEEIDERWDELLPYTLSYRDTVEDKDKILIAQKAKEHYLKNETVSLNNAFDHIKMYTDRLFVVDAVRAVHLQAKVAKSPVYYYLFDMPVIYKAKLPVVAHGDDPRMLFKHRDSAKVLSDNDRKMKNIFLDFLYNFATKGKPDINGVKWEPVAPSSDTETKFMRISSPDLIHMETEKNIGDSDFWDALPFKENDRLFKTKQFV